MKAKTKQPDTEVKCSMLANNEEQQVECRVTILRHPLLRETAV